MHELAIIKIRNLIKMKQTTSTILLIKPAHFTFNSQTAASNSFQQTVMKTEAEIMQEVLLEFENFVAILSKKGIEVIIENDTDTPVKPDAVFPNNWVSFHSDGSIVLYPMFAENRRLERRIDIVERIKNQFQFDKIIDLSNYEQESKFLEGTGSIVFDHKNATAYACLSPRTHKELFKQFCEMIHYKPISFYALDNKGKEIYHTNVMMCIAEKFAVVCLDSITNDEEREHVANSLIANGHELIPISLQQISHFAGNMLALHTASQQPVLVMSQSAYNSLTNEQILIIEQYTEIIPIPIHTIETIGGGSARCMIAEIFTPLN